MLFSRFKQDLERILKHLGSSRDSKCTIPQLCYTHTKKDVPSQPLPSHSQLEKPKGQGFSYGAVTERVMIHCGRARARTVFNCLVVIFQILRGDIGPRVMKKINTQSLMCSAILKCSIYLLIKEGEIRVHLSFFCINTIHHFCLSTNWHIMFFQLHKQQDVA